MLADPNSIITSCATPFNHQYRYYLSPFIGHCFFDPRNFHFIPIFIGMIGDLRFLNTKLYDPICTLSEAASRLTTLWECERKGVNNNTRVLRLSK